ncbi:probable aminotransferase TAT2 [Ipomoea triloba]|uniref:probable aminotransferase TAT2 n=1 Tax=Ipomoea triloba TaxID=35885 RepID=UPI00125D3651|nr:probable aminotransferase TAT2 [Ipomoea triloba]
MENKLAKWSFKKTNNKSAVSIRSVLEAILEKVNEKDAENGRPLIHLGRGDPSLFPCFRTSPVAEDSINASARSAKFNGYSPATGIYPARRSVAEYLSCDLPHKLSPDDVYLTVGANQAIEVIMAVLGRPGVNILLPKPGYPFYEVRAAFSNVEVRHYNLLPEKGWEVDLNGIEALADGNTIAMVVINPGNPCGSVYSHAHLQKIAETAQKLGVLLIADEVYGHLSFGCKPFVAMGQFGSITPVISLGSISKRWILPGWRLGWIATIDPNEVLKKSGIVECLRGYLDIGANPATVIQGAVPQTLEKTPKDFFLNINNMLREAADSCYAKLEDIPCLSCPYKPEGAMSMMVKLNVSLLEDIDDDMDFCVKLAKEELVLVLPGIALGMKNWIRITFAVELASLEDGLKRLKAFWTRHAKKQSCTTADGA